MAMKATIPCPVRFLWEQSIDEPGTANLIKVQGNWDHVAAVWRQDNGKWRFSVYRPNGHSSTIRYASFAKAQAACIEEIKKQYREITTALCKLSAG